MIIYFERKYRMLEKYRVRLISFLIRGFFFLITFFLQYLNNLQFLFSTS